MLVYQMGKVGSTSVYRSVQQQHSGSVMWAHTLGPHHEQFRTRFIYNWAVTEGKPLKIVSLTRDPIGRNVSEFFQNFDQITGSSDVVSDFSVQELRTIFLAKYSHGLPLYWYDLNIQAHFGIDVFATPFPEDGMALYSQGHAELLVLQSEIDDRCKEAAIGEFLGLPDFRLTNANISADKPYARIYRAFCNEVRLPAALVDWMCQSRYFNHFYDQAIITAVRERWTTGETPSGDVR